MKSGGGQLGRMLLQAASPLALPIIVLDNDINAPAKQVSQPSLIPLLASSSAAIPLQHLHGHFTDEAKIRELAQQVDVLTIEIEHVDVAALEAVATEFKSIGGRSGKGIKVYPAPSVIRVIQDKYAQKVHLAARGVIAAPFRPIIAESPMTTSPNDVQTLRKSIVEAGDAFGYPYMLKSRHLAYDGNGNYILRSGNSGDIDAALAALIPSDSGRPLGERLYAEKFAPFVKEIAVMVVRGADGQTRTYPAVETIHRESVCHIVYAPLRPTSGEFAGVGRSQRGMGSVAGKDVGTRAREQAERAIDALGEGAVGVFGVEMFLMADG